MIHTSFTETFGTVHPLIQAGMGDAGPELVVAVCEAGALGSLGTIGKTPDQVAAEVAEVRRRTSRPFAVNIVTFDWAPFARDHVGAALAEGAPILTLSFGDPLPGLSAAREAGARVMVQVQSPEGARASLAAGCDLVIAQGTEAGGHTGLRGTLSFAAQVLAAAGATPVAVAGGIADGRGVAAVLAMGAAAAVVGTRFKTCPEHPASEQEKAEILASDGATYAGPENDDAYGLEWPKGIVGRAIRNAFTHQWQGRRDALRTAVARQSEMFGFVRDTAAAGRPVNWGGESAALVHQPLGAADVVRTIMGEAEAHLRRVHALLELPTPA